MSTIRTPSNVTWPEALDAEGNPLSLASVNAMTREEREAAGVLLIDLMRDGDWIGCGHEWTKGQRAFLLFTLAGAEETTEPWSSNATLDTHREVGGVFERVRGGR